MQLACGGVISASSFYLGGETPEVMQLPIGHDQRLPRTAFARLLWHVANRKNTFVTRLLVRPDTFVAVILGKSANPQICTSIIKLIAVDMVDNLADLRAHDKTMQERDVPIFPFQGGANKIELVLSSPSPLVAKHLICIALINDELHAMLVWHDNAHIGAFQS